MMDLRTGAKGSKWLWEVGGTKRPKRYLIASIKGTLRRFHRPWKYSSLDDLFEGVGSRARRVKARDERLEAQTITEIKRELQRHRPNFARALVFLSRAHIQHSQSHVNDNPIMRSQTSSSLSTAYLRNSAVQLLGTFLSSRLARREKLPTNLSRLSKVTFKFC